MVDIPPEHLLYKNLQIATSNGPEKWIAVFDEEQQVVDVRRGTMFPLSASVLSLAFLVAFTCVIAAIHFYTDVDVFMKFIIALIFSIVVFAIPFGYASTVRQNSNYWGGILHMRFDKEAREFFFPRENAVYEVKDCPKIILGCVWGYETDGVEEFMGMLVRKRQNKHDVPIVIPCLECFVLLLSKEEGWKRHDIAFDAAYVKRPYGSHGFAKLIELLQPLTKCEVFFQKYSLRECYDQQRGRATQE